jgi:hypothetical protein
MQADLKDCLQCHAPLIEIDYYGQRLIGCIQCNRWGPPLPHISKSLCSGPLLAGASGDKVSMLAGG